MDSAQLTYLSGPRIVFSGKFVTNLSTVQYYMMNCSNATSPRYTTIAFKSEILDHPSQAGPNPYGTEAWSLSKCAIRSITLNSGETVTKLPENSQTDVALDGVVSSDQYYKQAKCTFLDSDNPQSFQIWGLNISLVDSKKDKIFEAKMRPATLRNMWNRLKDGKLGDPTASAYYQSVLEDIKWGETKSPMIQKFKEEIKNTTMLSIRLTVDGFAPPSKSLDLTPENRRIIGVIGPYNDSNPESFLLSRQLSPAAGTSYSAKEAIAQVYKTTNGDNLAIDLCNSLSTSAPGGNLSNHYEDLYVAYKGSDGTFKFLPDGKIPYDTDNWLETTGGIFTIPVPNGLDISQEVVSVVKLVLIKGKEEKSDKYVPMPILSESSAPGLEGLSIKADKVIYRLDFEEKDTVTFYVTKFGQPCGGITIKLEQDNILKADNASTSKELITDSKGVASLDIFNQGSISNNQYTDYAVSLIRYYIGDDHAKVPADNGDRSNLITVLIWGYIPIPEEPNWNDDIQSILIYYANIYPAMEMKWSLSNYERVVENRESLKKALTIKDMNDPDYTPAARKLSESNRKIILRWLDNPLKTAKDADKRGSLDALYRYEDEMIKRTLGAILKQPIEFNVKYTFGVNHE